MNVYLVGKAYQRRAEVLAPLFDANLVYLPHRFRARLLRPLDYALKVVAGMKALRRFRPSVIYVQAPPLFVALPALALGIPYVLDCHNPVWQGYWGRLPFSDLLLRRAKCIVVHNDEIAAIAARRWPSGVYFTVRDPIVEIRHNVKRKAGQVLVICSFDPGEPVELIADAIEAMPTHHFFITADIGKTAGDLQKRLAGMENLTLTGFLDTADYQRLLCSSQCALVLEEKPATQPSGACEALSSDTPLVTSRSRLSERLFGEWAELVNHDVREIVAAIRRSGGDPLDLRGYRDLWNAEVDSAVEDLRAFVGQG